MGSASTSPARLRDGWALSLAALLVVTGVLHFVHPEDFDAIVPHFLPQSPRFWTSLSGVSELVLALGVAWPAGRRRCAAATAVFFLLVFPANVQMALDAIATHPTSDIVIALLRLPLQLPLIWWAWHVHVRTTA